MGFKKLELISSSSVHMDVLGLVFIVLVMSAVLKLTAGFLVRGTFVLECSL